MTEAEAWRPFLERWSREWIGAHDPGRDRPLDPAVVRDGWLGFAPADPAAVAAAEDRLGRRLPPSLREFLLVTDGWRDAGSFVYRLAGAADLAWLKDTDDRHWIDVYADIAHAGTRPGGAAGGPGEGAARAGEGASRPGDGAEGGADGDAGGGADGDAEEVSWEEEQARLLARCLRVSLAADAAILLLDPDDVDEDGEWAGYWLASWSGEGPQRHASFRAVMEHLYRGFHALRRPAGATRDHWDGEVERARRAALAGAVDEPLSVLAEAQAYGSERAKLLRMQLQGLLGDWYTVGLTNLLWRRSGDVALLSSPLFAAELMPLLFRREDHHQPYELRLLDRVREIAPPPVRALIDDYAARRARPGFRLVFGGGPEFDAAVHAVADRLAAHPAFRTLDRPRVSAHQAILIGAGTAPPRLPEAQAQSQAQAQAQTPARTAAAAGERAHTRTRARRLRRGHEEAAASWSDRADRADRTDPRRMRAERAALCEEAWPELRAAMRLWRPVCADHVAPISLFADPVLAQLVTRERGREILATPRG